MKKPFREEFSGAELGDLRRSERLAELGLALAAFPAASLPESLRDGAALEAAYRFLSNESVDAQNILGPHRRETSDRCKQRDEVVVAHDSTDFVFRGNRRGLGRMRGRLERGFFAHLALAISADEWREPLGVLHLESWTRGPKKRAKQIPRKRARTTDLESRRWERGVEAVSRQLVDARAIHVMDREADAYDVLSYLIEHQQRFVVRSAVDRLLVDGDHLDDALDRKRIVVTRDVPLGERRRQPTPNARRLHPPRLARSATLGIKAAAVTLARPWTQLSSLPRELAMHVVLVEEIHPPRGEAPIKWRLLTTEPIDTPKQIERIVDSYRARWRVEEYFKALKTGCAIEKRQLETYDGLINALAVYVPIAWRILRHRSLAQGNETQPASTILSKLQLRLLRRGVDQELPRTPTINDALYAIARLGGHLMRNGPPGWITLARGYERLIAMEDGAKLALDL